jgi:hypothetical protein
MKDSRGSSSASFSKGLFYRVGARELPPAGWRWFSACVERAHSLNPAQGLDELVYLGGAVFQRTCWSRACRSGNPLARPCRQVRLGAARIAPVVMRILS